MRSAASRCVRALLRRFGVDIVHYPHHHAGHKRVRLLHHYGIDQVFDVGASSGGYGRELREFGYRGEIVSFEPLGTPYAQLRHVAALDARWTAVNVALGAVKNTAHMNVAANSASSSFLPMKDAHERAAPWARYVGEESVSVVTLDDVFDHYRKGTSPFLKLDVQGYEEQVLDGASRALRHVRGVQLEMSLVPLYEGTWLFTEAVQYFQRAGFGLVSLEPGFYDRGTGQLLQTDGVFMRSPEEPLPPPSSERRGWRTSVPANNHQRLGKAGDTFAV
jgi:FkbM family methyltransferase